MHSFYLRTCYLENQLARGEMELAGVRLHLDAVSPGPVPGRGHRPTTSPRGPPPTTPPSWSRATPGSCSAPRATSRGSSTRPAPRRGTGPTTTSSARPRRLAGRGDRAPRLLVGRLGRLGQGPRRPAPQAPAHGQRPLPPYRRRPGQLHPREVGGRQPHPPESGPPVGEATPPGERAAPDRPQPHTASPTAADASGGRGRRLLTPQAVRSKMAAMPWPPPMHMVTRAAPAAGALELVERLDGQDAAGGADRMAERDAAAVRVDPVRGRGRGRGPPPAPGRRRPR